MWSLIFNSSNLKMLFCEFSFSWYPELDLNQFGVSHTLESTVPLAGIFSGGVDRIRVGDLIAQLENVYCSSMGAEFEHLQVRSMGKPFSAPFNANAIAGI